MKTQRKSIFESREDPAVAVLGFSLLLVISASVMALILGSEEKTREELDERPQPTVTIENEYLIIGNAMFKVDTIESVRLVEYFLKDDIAIKINYGKNHTVIIYRSTTQNVLPVYEKIMQNLLLAK